MTRAKRIVVSVPPQLLQELDGFLAVENQSRSDLIREAVRLYLTERKRRAMRENLKRGYREMATINLTLAEEGLAAEVDSLSLTQGRFGRDE